MPLEKVGASVKKAFFKYVPVKHLHKNSQISETFYFTTTHYPGTLIEMSRFSSTKKLEPFKLIRLSLSF